MLILLCESSGCNPNEENGNGFSLNQLNRNVRKTYNCC